MSWSGLDLTPEFATWAATQSNLLPSTFTDDPSNPMTIEEEFYMSITNYWTQPIYINYVSNNCN